MLDIQRKQQNIIHDVVSRRHGNNIHAEADVASNEINPFSWASHVGFWYDILIIRQFLGLYTE